MLLLLLLLLATVGVTCTVAAATGGTTGFPRASPTADGQRDAYFFAYASQLDRYACASIASALSHNITLNLLGWSSAPPSHHATSDAEQVLIATRAVASRHKAATLPEPLLFFGDLSDMVYRHDAARAVDRFEALAAQDGGLSEGGRLIFSAERHMSSGSREANALHHRWYTDRWAQRRSSSTGSGGVEPSRYILAAMMAGGVDALEQFWERSAWEDYLHRYGRFRRFQSFAADRFRHQAEGGHGAGLGLDYHSQLFVNVLGRAERSNATGVLRLDDGDGGGYAAHHTAGNLQPLMLDVLLSLRELQSARDDPEPLRRRLHEGTIETDTAGTLRFTDVCGGFSSWLLSTLAQEREELSTPHSQERDGGRAGELLQCGSATCEGGGVACQETGLARFGTDGYQTAVLSFGVKLRTCEQQRVGLPEVHIELHVPPLQRVRAQAAAAASAAPAGDAPASALGLTVTLEVHGCRVFVRGLQPYPWPANANVKEEEEEDAWLVRRSNLFAELHDQNRFGTLKRDSDEGGATNFVALLLRQHGDTTVPPSAAGSATAAAVGGDTAPAQQRYTAWLTSNVGATAMDQRGSEDSMTLEGVFHDAKSLGGDGAGAGASGGGLDWAAASVCVRAGAAVEPIGLEVSALRGQVGRVDLVEKMRALNAKT